jgi:hypothetical protein
LLKDFSKIFQLKIECLFFTRCQLTHSFSDQKSKQANFKMSTNTSLPYGKGVIPRFPDSTSFTLPDGKVTTVNKALRDGSVGPQLVNANLIDFEFATAYLAHVSGETVSKHFNNHCRVAAETVSSATEVVRNTSATPLLGIAAGVNNNQPSELEFKLKIAVLEKNKAEEKLKAVLAEQKLQAVLAEQKLQAERLEKQVQEQAAQAALLARLAPTTAQAVGMAHRPVAANTLQPTERPKTDRPKVSVNTDTKEKTYFAGKLQATPGSNTDGKVHYKIHCHQGIGSDPQSAFVICVVYCANPDDGVSYTVPSGIVNDIRNKIKKAQAEGKTFTAADLAFWNDGISYSKFLKMQSAAAPTQASESAGNNNATPTQASGSAGNNNATPTQASGSASGNATSTDVVHPGMSVHMFYATQSRTDTLRDSSVTNNNRFDPLSSNGTR